MMELVLIMLTVQAGFGALDNLWHHEITERLPSKPSARDEMALHTAREFLYAAIFILVGWFELNGLWAWALAGILTVEIVITLADFVIEDQTRTLPKFERILHTILAINVGAIFAVLIPVLWKWQARDTALIPVDYGLWSWLMTVFAVGVFLWGVRNAVAVVLLTIRRVPTWKRKPIRAGYAEDMRTILVAGGTGFVGRHLCRRLIERGDNLIVLTRTREKAEDLYGPHACVIEDLHELGPDARLDAIVNLTGARIIGPLWTQRRKQVLRDSRLNTTNAIVEYITQAAHKPDTLLTASAIGYYGVRDNVPLTESDDPQDIFMSEMCQAREAAADDAVKYGVRVCKLRFGLVLGTDDGAFPPLALPAKFGLGAILGNGRQWMSWIHVADAVGAIEHLIGHPDVAGAFNLTAPHPVMQRTFTKALGHALRRPVWLRVPKWPLKALLGEMADIFVEGQRVVPARLIRSGYKYRFPTLETAMAALTAEPAFGELAETIYYNDACPVCRTEIRHYHQKACANRLPVEIADVNVYPEALQDFGLTADDLRRRLYVLDGAGNLHCGVDAIIAIWAALPGYRRLVRFMRLPGIYHLLAVLYHDVLAKVVYNWDVRRRQKQTKRPQLMLPAK